MPSQFAASPRVVLGRLVATPALLEAVAPADLVQAVTRHSSGDWGLGGEDDRAANDAALLYGDRILSVYETASGVRFWLITEADRSSTTALLPDEY
jgi:hypothetical protein